jgi:hypothetical protein
VLQFGFKENSSTEKATYKLIKEILDSLNYRKVTGELFCDLQKAFDSVNHKILLDKLEFYGITTSFLNWI